MNPRNNVQHLRPLATWPSKVTAFRQSFDFSDEDWVGTQELKRQLAEHMAQNPDAGLTIDLFKKIVSWKLERQEARTRRLRGAQITPDVVANITRCALTLVHPDRRTLMRGQLTVLQGISGVGVGVASAILALTFPDRYGVIDERVRKVCTGYSILHLRFPTIGSICPT